MLDTGHWTLDTGHWTLDTGHWMLDTGHWTLDKWTLDTGHWTSGHGCIQWSPRVCVLPLPSPWPICLQCCLHRDYTQTSTNALYIQSRGCTLWQAENTEMLYIMRLGGECALRLCGSIECFSEAVWKFWMCPEGWYKPGNVILGYVDALDVHFG